MRVGGRPIVSADKSLAHLDALIEQCPGLTQTHFARLAGVASNAFVVARRSGRVEVTTEERILAVQPRHVALCPPPQMPTSIVRTHVEALLDQPGVYRNTVARTAGVNYQTVYNVLAEKWPTVKYHIYAALMSVTADDLRAEAFWVDRRATTTRLRALQANSWPLAPLGEMHGMNLSTLVNADLDSPMFVTVERRVKAIYDAIGDEVGPSPRSATIARRMGYFPPIYYDEDMNLIEVDEVDDEQEAARTTLCILGLTLEGQSVAQIVATLGCRQKDVARARRAYGVAIGRTIDGGYEAVETREGAFAAIRAAIRDVHYRSTIEALDTPDTDYVALLGSLTPAGEESAAA